MKHTLLLLILFISPFTFSQFLDWVASGEYVDMNIVFSSMDEKRNLVVGGAFGKTGEMNESFLVDGKGNVAEIPLNYSGIDYYKAMFHIVSYAADGELKWHLEILNWHAEIHGISHSKSGNILLFVYVPGFYTESGENGKSEEERTHGWFPEIYPSEDEAELWKTGYYAVRLSPDGKLIGRTLLFDGLQDPEIEFDDFQSYLDEGFLVHGMVDRDFNYSGTVNLPLEDEEEGHVIFAFDKAGQLLWSDLIRYPGGISSLYRSMASSPDGNVYLAGTSNRGLEFSNGEKVKYDRALSGKNRQSYLLAYSPQGKIRWLKFSGTNASVHQLEATNEQVFISYLVSPGEVSAFGFAVDTAGKKMLVTSSFSAEGKKLWSFSEPGVRVHDLEVKDTVLYIYAQQPLRKYWEKVGEKNVPRFEYSYLSQYTVQGRFIRSRVYPFDVENDEINAFLFPFSEKEIYISMNFREGFTRQLDEVDVKFGKLHGSGWPGMIGRLK